MKIKKNDISSIFPIIINIIKLILDDINRFAKFIFCKLYISELTVFIIVKIPNLNEVSKSKFEIVNNIDTVSYTHLRAHET